MKCETCEHDFPDSTVRIWKSKKVCPGCFQTLTAAPAESVGSTGRTDTDRNWELLAGNAFAKQEVSQDWIDHNNSAEKELRDRVKAATSFLLSDEFGVLSGTTRAPTLNQVHIIHRSIYTFFFAYSFVLTWEIFDNDSPFFPYQKRFRSLGPATYLGQLFGDLYCMNVVADSRFNVPLVRHVVTAASVILSRTELLSWGQYCEIAQDEPRFLHEVAIRMYRSLAGAIGLPTDDRTLEAVRQDSLSTRLLLVVAGQHSKMYDNPGFMAGVGSILGLHS